jgi:hypothetical protein
MGLIREPDGVDFVVESRLLTEKEREQISAYIREYNEKEKRKLKLKKKKAI